MANLPGIRIRDNGVFGTTIDNPLTSGAVAFNSLGLVPLSVVSGDHAMITLDPVRQYGNPEIVMVTAHTAAASVATIQRGMYGTTARSHPQGTLWTHSADDQDFIEVLTSATRPADPYNGQIIYETDNKAYKAREQVGSAWEDLINPIGAWLSWVPVWTNLTVGSGTVIAKYQKIGRTINFRIRFIYGVGSAVGTGPVYTLPVTAASDYIVEWPIGTCVGVDNGIKAYILITQFNSTTQGLLRTDDGLGSFGNVTATVPFTWASGDYFMIMGSYEAAS